MQECILAVLWSKKDIVSFFKAHSIPTNTMKCLNKHEEENLNRAAMVRTMFEALAAQNDNGTIHFNLMLDTLSSWTDFDSFWFKQGKLDGQQAKKLINDLKSSKEKNVDATKARIKIKQQKDAALEEKHQSLEEMKKDFHVISTSSETSQKRGYALEKFLGKMARFFDLKVTGAFKIKGTQIDGSIKYDGENYNIEAKWHDHHLSDEPLLAFCHKQEITMHGRGIFISINGFTQGALQMLERSNIKNTVLMDGEDIALILTEMIDLPTVLDRKIRAAQTKGAFYIHPITGEIKIKN